MITSGSWGAEQGVDQSVDQTLLNEWQNITIVKEAGKMSLYLNGEKDHGKRQECQQISQILKRPGSISRKIILQC